MPLIYSRVAVCMFYAVRCPIIIRFSLLFANYWACFLIFFLCLFSSFVCLLSILCILRVLFPLLYISLYLLFFYKFTEHCHWVETQLQ